MPQHARALAGAACALALSASMFAPAAFADDAEGDGTATSRNAIFAAADSIRGELGPALSTYDQAKKTLEALEATDIATARVQGLQDVMYDGTEKRPTVTLRIDSIKDGKKTEASLREGVDFNVQFDGDLINPGTVHATITGAGDYTGTVETSFVILPADLANATVDMIPDHVRTGYPIEPDPVVKLDGRTLVKGVDYEVSYSENVNEGTATLMVKGIGNCACDVSDYCESQGRQNRLSSRAPLRSRCRTGLLCCICRVGGRPCPQTPQSKTRKRRISRKSHASSTPSRCPGAHPHQSRAPSRIRPPHAPGPHHAPTRSRATSTGTMRQH